MRIASFFKFYIVLIALLFIFYSFYDIGLKQEIFLFLAISFLSPYIFKETIKIRGVKKGDLVLVSFRTERPFGFFMQKLPARALTDGKLGEVIEVEFEFKRAKGEILSYGGLFFPPEVNLLYYEEDVIKREIR
jgi:hypothetical protein